jgi:YjbE family integral membrane protein
MSAFMTPEFWIALSQIIMINIVLSGDNAVVIALASRSLPPAQQKKAILFGSVGAIVLRIVLTFFAVFLLSQPYLKLVGAALLLWIGVGLLKGDDDEAELEGHSSLAAAIKTIIVADLVMSLDNVLGVAAAAKGNVVLLVVGLVISIPLIIYGSTLILKFFIRYPILIVAGAALIGWIAGEIWLSDPAIAEWSHALIETNGEWLEFASAAAGALFVVVLGKVIAARAEQKQKKVPVVDLAGEEHK